ncbi:hypothetical protein SELMODRAFT_123396 [Selaginella moellendorffii]|uniref:Uncharacterized protein GRXs3 n=1 Tax=Selaginella moellendorffii TaxID=88036 RepID=D8SRX5_SELML|nr:hypothetical protein SELMODRAFT_123396 [Selaginella moellendorffii]
MVEEARGLAHLDEVVKAGKSVVLHFRTPWCEASKQMDVVFEQLCADTAPRARFLRVEAEEHPEISEKYSVSLVPYFVFIKVEKEKSLNRCIWSFFSYYCLGEALADAKLKSQENGSKAHANGSDKGPEETLEERLKKLIHSHDVMLFMKGSPSEPKCGFSKKVAGALEEVGVPFGSFDILSDEEVRQGIKSFSNWPTFPQLYVKGELIGGCDIVMEMHKSGELKEAVGATEEKEDINSRLKKLIHSSPTMLFMKGTPEEPKCGFSKKVASALKEEGIEFGSFDILSDEGLKAFSNWPTYPQLYLKGELIGGCDIIMEMKENKELKEALAS